MNGVRPFVFYTERRLVMLTGRRAKNLQELVGHLRSVSGSSIFYHTHHQFLSQHFEKPVFHSDFAKWVGRALLEDRLAEKLTAVDLMSLTTLRQVREAILGAVEERLSADGLPSRDARPGDEFHFCESQSFLMPTGMVASSADELMEGIARSTNISLFFHFFEARLRLERATNDFSEWLRDLGQPGLAGHIEKLDPYVMTLDELRDQIVRLGREMRDS
ncbi:MAG: DUF5752 family protein [Bryobacteraceae bacterium]